MMEGGVMGGVWWREGRGELYLSFDADHHIIKVKCGGWGYQDLWK